MSNIESKVKNVGIAVEKVTFWEAGESIHNLIRDGFQLTREDLEELEAKFPNGFVLLAWYGENEGEADVYEEF